ncbi:MAG: aldo/keto reductase [bacterium]
MPSNANSIDRRRFVKLSAASTGLALGGVSMAEETSKTGADGGMKYRPLGKTGLKVSEIGFGSYGFNNPALLSAALDAGMNFICTSADYQDGAAEEAIGKAIGKVGNRRDEIVIFTGTEVRRGNKTKKEILETLDGSLKRLGTDHIDVMRSHNIMEPGHLKNEAFFEAFEEAKKAGKALHAGMSCHTRMQECISTAIDDGRIEVILCRYNFMPYQDQPPLEDALFERAKEKGIGVAVFKIDAGKRQNEIKDLESGGLTLTQAAAKWALSNPNVASICAGITNFNQIKEYSGAVGKKLGQAEIDMLQRYADEMYDKYCRHCGTCESSCPYGVAVADVMRYAMYFRYYGREKDSMNLYASLPKECTAAGCSSCDAPCQGACPFGRRIREGLVEAHGMLI